MRHYAYCFFVISKVQFTSSPGNISRSAITSMAMDWGGKDIIGNRIQCTGVVEETTGNRKYAMANGR